MLAVMKGRRAWAAAAALGAAALSLVPAQASPAVTPEAKAAAVSDNPRPQACPSANNDPNSANDGAATTKEGTFPWPAPVAGTDPEKYSSYLRTSPVAGVPERPANWSNGGGDWKLTSARTTDPAVARNPQELCGVEGNSVDKAWETTTGRPDTVVAITDSGIEWCDASIAAKVYLNRAALPYPENAQGQTKPQLEAQGVHFPDADPYDLNGTGVLNVNQYAHDPRVAQVVDGPPSKGFFCGSYITAEDLIRTFGTPRSPFYYPTSDPRAEAPAYPGQSPPGFTEAIERL